MQNNESKYVAIVALIVAIIGISVGFAAYSSALQIKAGADVNYGGGGGSLFTLGLSTATNSLTNGSVTPTVVGATADAATLNTNIIQGISVHFTATGQKATYTFYGVNTSSFIGYLNSVVMGSKTCAAYSGNGNPASVGVADACDDIIFTVTAGTADYTETNNNINSHQLNAGGYETIKVEIEYIDGGAVADGDFTVDFGTTSLTYSTVD